MKDNNLKNENIQNNVKPQIINPQEQVKPIQEEIEVVNFNEPIKPKQEELSDKIIKVAEGLVNTTDKTDSFDKDEIKTHKTFALLCYLGPLLLLPLINKLHRKSKYMSFHINQGVNIIILYILVFIFSGILTSLFKEVYMYSSYTPGWVLFVNYVLNGIVIILNILGIVNTASNKSKELPLIGKFRFIK